MLLQKWSYFLSEYLQNSNSLIVQIILISVMKLNVKQKILSALKTVFINLQWIDSSN